MEEESEEDGVETPEDAGVPMIGRLFEMSPVLVLLRLATTGALFEDDSSP